VWAVAFSLLAVVSAIPSGPVASLTVDDAYPAIGQVVHFNASASRGHDQGKGLIVAYRFVFGDGQRTDWQSSPLATHAYTRPANETATVTVVDRRDLTGTASLTIHVSSAPPPPVPTPDVIPVRVLLSPAKPHVNDSVNLTVDVINRGSAPASAAEVDAYDRRPDGTIQFLGSVQMGAALPAAQGTSVPFPAFLAVQVGNHTLRIVVTNITPAPPTPRARELNVTMTVLASGGHPQTGPGDGSPAFDVGPLAIALSGVAVAAMAGAGYFLLRRPPKGPLEPPSAEPPDRSPPPLWPP
jgi:hypothetical protein